MTAADTRRRRRPDTAPHHIGCRLHAAGAKSWMVGVGVVALIAIATVVAGTVTGGWGRTDLTRAAWSDEVVYGVSASAGEWVTSPGGGGFPGGITEGNDATVISDVTWAVPNPRTACALVELTGTSATPRPWHLDIDQSALPWSGATLTYDNFEGTARLLGSTGSIAHVGGVSNAGAWHPRTNNTPIANTQTALVTICLYSVPPAPPADPSWYTVEVVQGEWTNTKACQIIAVRTTLTDLDEFPFFYRWTTTVDMTAAKAQVANETHMTFTPYPDGSLYVLTPPQFIVPIADTYTATSRYAELRAQGGGADSFTFTVCLEGWA